MATVLLIDDDPDIVEAARLVLEHEGHQVLCAHNRRDGLEMARASGPDLVILDVMMEEPDDGIAMAQELRRERFSAPILLLTSLGKVTGYRFGRSEGLVPVDDYQEKPIDPAALVAKVAELLQRKET